jgi:hypothetical protein
MREIGGSSGCPSACFMSEKYSNVYTKKFSTEFDFGLYWSNITPTSCQIQIKFYTFSQKTSSHVINTHIAISKVCNFSLNIIRRGKYLT